tara:strand:- start:2123 stop:2383 length:261 start_codon:yes stop_codon:yes gene_type:complete
MDILDDYPQERKSIKWNYFSDDTIIPDSEQLKDDERKELTRLVGMCMNRVVSTNEYYRRLAEFWRNVGEDSYAEEALQMMDDEDDD